MQSLNNCPVHCIQR